MNQFQYAIARACYEAYKSCRSNGNRILDFDDLDPECQRCWLAGAQASVDKLQDIVGVGLI